MAGGMDLHFLRALNFIFRSLKKRQKSLNFPGISGIFLELSASVKYFSDSGEWLFRMPPIQPATMVAWLPVSTDQLAAAAAAVVGNTVAAESWRRLAMVSEWDPGC